MIVLARFLNLTLASSRIAHLVDFPDYNENELLEITKLIVDPMHYYLD